MVLVAMAIDFAIENLRRNRVGGPKNLADLLAFLELVLLFR
jgi:hypothetical protein